MKQSKFMETGILAAKLAGEVIMKYYSGDVRVELKGDETPVTAADREAEKVITKTIKSRFPEHSIMGEEFGSSAGDSEYTWIIDPVDGTKNYIRKIPMFATQIALMKNDELILGISNAPAMNELLYAERGMGAYFNNQKIHVSARKNLSESFMSFGGINHFRKLNLTPGLLELAGVTYSNRGFGDFWGYHLLAQGKIEIMIEADIKIWDIAALAVIIEEAGGKFTDLSGNAVSVNIKTAAASNGLLHEEVLKAFRR